MVTIATLTQNPATAARPVPTASVTRLRASGIDTHGFAILDRLRRSFPHTESLLMDRATLLDHEEHWAREAKPHVAHLPHLRPAEAELYQDLVEGAFGPSVRLEQERISYSTIKRQVWP